MQSEAVPDLFDQVAEEESRSRDIFDDLDYEEAAPPQRPITGATGTWEDESGLPPEMTNPAQRRELEQASLRLEGERLSAEEQRIPDLSALTEVPGGAENFLKIIQQQREFDKALYGKGTLFRPETAPLALEQGIDQAKDEFLVSQATPLAMGTQVATLGIGGGTPVLQAAGRIAGGVFGYEGVKGTIEGVERFQEAETPQEQIAALTGIGFSAGTALGGGAAALHRPTPIRPPELPRQTVAALERGAEAGLSKSVAAAADVMVKEPPKPEVPAAPPAAQEIAPLDKFIADVESGAVKNTEAAWEVGRTITTPEEIARLKQAYAQENVRAAERSANYENATPEQLAEFSAKSNNPSIIMEAIEEAVGASPFKGTGKPGDAAKVKALVDAGKPINEKSRTQTQPVPEGQTPVVEQRVGAVPQDVSAADAAAKARAGEAVVEPVGPGMGGALKAEAPDARAQLAQLTDSIKTLAAEGKTQPAKAFDLGETMSRAKDSLKGAIEGLKAAGQYMKVKLEGKPTTTEYKGVLGDRHLALSESAVNARKWMKNVTRAIPDLKTREAISNWVDAGGDLAVLDRAATETTPAYKAGYEQAKKLTPEQRTVAENLKNYFESRLQEAIDAGVLEDGIENYIHRVYEAESPWKKGVIQELRSGLFTGKPALAKQRVFEYDFEAEKAGKKPVKDFSKRVVAYDLALNKAIADRQAVKAMMEIKMSDGRPMIDVGGGGKVIENPGETPATIINRSAKKIDPENPKADRGDFKPYDHPALRKWKWATEDTAGNPIFVQGDVLIHPEAIRDIRTLLEPSAIRRNPVGRAALGVSSTIKQTMLDLSLFHQVQIGVHALEHKTFGPVKEIDFNNPDVRGLVRGGAVVGETSGHQAFSEGLSGSSLTKHIPWFGERISAYKDYLFGDFIPRIKVAMGLHALERNRSRFKNLSQDELYTLTANQMNAAFGELNYEMMGRSKTTQDALRLTLLAPDFLEARGRFAAQAGTVYGGLPHFREGKFTMGEQGNALMLGAATMYILARIMNKLINDEYHFELKNAFNVVYNGKSYGLRTVQGDLIHAATDPGKFVNHRLNPVYGRPVLEFTTGRDYFGRKRDALDKLQDMAMTPIPIVARGALSGQEQTLMESFLNSMGAVVKRDSPSSDMSVLATEWKKENKVTTGPGEFIYDADKDPYRPIKLAAERGDEAGVRSEIAKAMSEGLKRSRILEHFKLSSNHYFAGSAANERKFVASLTEDQKKIYRDAVAERKRILELVRRAAP